jgi:hypothetical protein
MPPEAGHEARGDVVDHQDAVQEALEEEGQAGFTNDAITNASTAHALNSTFSDTEVEAALNAMGTKVNSILTVLRANGLIEAS